MKWVSLDDLMEQVSRTVGGYRVPTPQELAKKIEKKKKEMKAKPKPPKPKRKKRPGGGLRKKPPKQKPRPGGSQAKAKVDRVPAQLQHCVLAVRGREPSKKRAGGKPQKRYSTRAAWNICRWSLTRHGYLKPPYKMNAKLSSLRQTQKGVRRTMKHAMEKEGPAKYKRFKDLFREIEPTV